MILVALILFSVILNTSAQLLLKVGMTRIGHFDFAWNNIIPITLDVIFNPCIIGGIIIFVGSLSTWLLVLSRAELSFAYPLASLGYITTALAAHYWLGEHLTLTRVMGIIVIIAGVYLISRS